jgi:hypothetical protein
LIPGGESEAADMDEQNQLPLVDEPYTDEQQREDVAARAEIARGECAMLEEVKREFGL